MGLSATEEVLVTLAMRGGPEYAAEAEAAAASTGMLGKAVLKTSADMQTSTKNTWLHNQALYTARRYAFYGTLAISGLAFEVGKLGMSYLSTLQTARVALKGMFPDTAQMNTTIGQLYKMSTLSPFLFKDTLTGFRTMAPAMKQAGFTVSETLGTMRATMDALSQSGHTSVGSLSRVSLQLQHMANIGRPTGQVLLALARDGLPVYPALRHELGLTGTSLEDLASSGLTAKQVIEALNKYIETSPIYKGQAFKQATSTLQGNWQMFKDILAQAAGRAEGGLFGGLTNMLKSINQYLVPMFQANKPIGLYNIAEAIDHAISPSSHIVLNLFVTFDTLLKTVITELGLVGKAISLALYPLDKLFSLFGINQLAAKGFGAILGTIISLFILGKAVLLPFVLAWDLWKATVKAAEVVAVVFRATQMLLNGEFAAAWGLITANTAATATNTASNVTNTASVADRLAIMGALSDGIVSNTVVTDAATLANEGLSLSFLGMLGPIALAAAALAGVIIYHKQLESLGLRGNRAVHNFEHHPLRHLGNIHPGGPGLGGRVLHDISNLWHPGRWVSGLAAGGTVMQSGAAWVGERGPELLNLPAGAQVTPLARSAGDGMFKIDVYPQAIYLDGKKIATVVAQAVTDKEARK